jgi:hypothetical protein
MAKSLQRWSQFVFVLILAPPLGSAGSFHACSNRDAEADFTSEKLITRYKAWHNKQLSQPVHVCGTRKALIWYPVAGIGDASARLALAFRTAVLSGWLFFVKASDTLSLCILYNLTLVLVVPIYRLVGFFLCQFFPARFYPRARLCVGGRCSNRCWEAVHGKWYT